VARCERQQGDIASLLDGAGQTALVRGANTGKPPGNDLATLGDEALQQANIAIRDGVDLLGTELADLLAAEELAAAARTTGRTGCPRRTATAGMAARATRSRWNAALGRLDLYVVGHSVSFSLCVARRLRVAGSGYLP